MPVTRASFEAFCNEQLDFCRSIPQQVPNNLANEMIKDSIKQVSTFVIRQCNDLRIQAISNITSLLRQEETAAVAPMVMFPSVAPPKPPVFDGNPLSFEEFKRRFNNLIAEDQSLNVSLKRQLLIDSLDDETKRVIEMMGDASLKDIMDRIEAKVRVNIDGEIIRQVTGLPKLEYNQPEAWSNLASLVSKISRAQTSLLTVHALIPELLKKVPPSTSIQLQGVNSFEELNTLVLQNLKYAKAQPSSVKTIATSAAGMARPPTARFCLLCNKQGHSAKMCSLSLEDKRESVFKNNLCFKCLKKGRHNGNQCPFNNQCEKCKRNHHTAICGIQFVRPSGHTVPKQIVAAQPSLPQSDSEPEEIIQSLNC